MARTLRIRAATILAAATVALPAGTTPKTSNPYTLRIRGHFYEHQQGTFEEKDALEIGGWNAFVKTPTVLIKVEVDGPLARENTATLAFAARSKGRVLEQRWINVSRDYFSEHDRVVLPFMLYGLSCAPIELTARLQTSAGVQALKKTLPMECGE